MGNVGDVGNVMARGFVMIIINHNHHNKSAGHHIG